MAIVILLIKMGADVNAQGGHFGNAFVAAAFHGHWAITNLLIDKEADVNAHRIFQENALQLHQREVTQTL